MTTPENNGKANMKFSARYSIMATIFYLYNHEVYNNNYRDSTLWCAAIDLFTYSTSLAGMQGTLSSEI